MSTPTAVIIGVGAEEGIGAAVCRRFASGGYHVIVGGRTAAKIGRVAESIQAAGGSAEPYVLDTTAEAQVVALFEHAMSGKHDHAPVDAVVFNSASLNQPLKFSELTVGQFEEIWRQNCLAGFIVGREAVRHFAPLGRGTVLFTGASGSLRGKPSFAQFAAAKSGLRMVAQSMAREYGPQGVHVAHIVIDGAVSGTRLKSAVPSIVERLGEDGLLNVDDVAENYWLVHRQARSAWTHELDLRPYKEAF